MAHDHHVSAHLHVEKRRGDIASRGPSVGTSLASDMIFKFAQTERSLPQLTQYFLPQSLVLRQPLSGSRLPSSPYLGRDFRIPSLQRMKDRKSFNKTNQT